MLQPISCEGAPMEATVRVGIGNANPLSDAIPFSTLIGIWESVETQFERYPLFIPTTKEGEPSLVLISINAQDTIDLIRVSHPEGDDWSAFKERFGRRE